MARLAASIWRAVNLPRVVALSPYSPKLTLAPTVATPLLRPFCSLRYFLLAGCNILRSWTLADALRRFRCRHRGGLRLAVLRHNLALEHPHLDADHAVCRLRLGKAVIDVGAQGMQRHPTFAIPFRARDLDAVQPARAHDLDALGAEAHCILHRAFHRAAEHDPLFELLRDRVGDELRIDFGLADLLDVQAHFRAHHLAQARAQRLDVLALLADDDTRPRAMDGDARVFRRPLDRDLADGGVRELLAKIVADLDVFVQRRREVFSVGVPLRSPVAIDRETKAGRIDFLSHVSSLFAVADGDVDVAGLLEDDVAAPLGARGEAPQVCRLVDADSSHLELVDVSAFVVFRIGNRRLEDLLDDLRALLGAEGEQGERLVDGQPANLVGDEPAFLGRQAYAAQDRFGFHDWLLTSSAASLGQRPSYRRSAP